MPYTIDPMGGTVPQAVIDFYKNQTELNSDRGGQNYFTDAQGFQWIPTTTDGGIWRPSAFGASAPSGYRRAGNAGQEASKIGEVDNYYDTSGKYTHTSGNEKVEGFGQQLAMLAAAVGGIGMLGGLAGVPMGFGGGAGAVAGGGGLGTGSGAFLGEGVASGIGAWDGAAGLAGGGLGTGSGAFLGEGLHGAGVWGADGSLIGGGAAGGAGGLGGAGGGGGLGGLGGSGGSGLSSMLGGNGLGGIATAVGGLLGSQGQNAETSSTRALDPRMDALFYGDLAPRAQGLLAGQMGQAQGVSNQLLGKGSELLGSSVSATNPHMVGVANDMQRRTQELLGENNLAIQGNAVGVGGLGGSRQGVAQGIAAGRAADSLQGQLANLNFGQFNADQNRLLQQQTLGAGMLSQGLQTPWAPLQNTAQTYSPFTGTGTTTNSQQSGGGWQGAIGGALGAAQTAKNLGWW